MACAVSEVRIFAFVLFNIGESTVACAVGDIRIIAFCHDALDDDVFLRLIYLLRRTVTN